MPKDTDLRFRLARLIEHEVIDYLQAESEWRPYLYINHTEEKSVIRFTYPLASDLPSPDTTSIVIDLCVK